MNGKTAEALPYFIAAADKVPQNAVYQNNVGVTLMRLNEYVVLPHHINDSNEGTILSLQFSSSSTFIAPLQSLRSFASF